MQVPLFHVNAFAGQPFTGNPAAVCLLNSWLDDESLRKVATENNLSATAFLLDQGIGYAIRWFTPRCEIRLCGHATLASAYIVLNFLKAGRETVQFSTRFSGDLTVAKDGDLFEMNFPSLFAKSCAGPARNLSRSLGIAESPAEVLEVNDTLVAVFDRQEIIRNIRPDFALLEQLHPYVVLATAPGEHADFVSRYFAPSYGVAEDPVTGSAHSILTPYWGRRLRKSKLHAQQLSERGGELWCELAGDRVLLKGNAVLTLQGTLTI